MEDNKEFGEENMKDNKEINEAKNFNVNDLLDEKQDKPKKHKRKIDYWKMSSIAFLVLLFGVYPKPLVDMVSSSIGTLIDIIQKAM